MRAMTGLFVACVLAATLIAADTAAEERAKARELETAAKAFLKAFREKDLDALTALSATPFLTGERKALVRWKTPSSVRSGLKGMLDDKAFSDSFPARLQRTLTWEQALKPGILGPAHEKEMREWFKEPIAVVGPGGGFAGLAPAVSRDKKGRPTAISFPMRMLLGVKDVKAKVFGIMRD
jgi:hypothetical protein